jgi:hypothetical protein
MEGKNRTIFVVLIAAVIAAAIFSSFGLNLFMPPTPDVFLPEVTDSGGELPDPGETNDNGYTRVEVLPDTVQDVIRTMVPLRPKSFHRTVKVDTALGNGTMGTTTNHVWADSGWTMVESTWPSGVIEYTIVGSGRVYRWFSGDQSYKVWDGGEADANMAQRIPTYEDVLDLNRKAITATGYESKNGLPCVYVEVAENELGNRERYWISVETGLLVAAETRKGEETLLLVSSGMVESPVQQGKAFALPDGTVLHRAGA